MNDLNDVEVKLIYILRNLCPYEKLEVNIPSRGRITWKITKTTNEDYLTDIQSKQ